MKYTILTLAIFITALSSQAVETKEELKALVIQVLNEQDWDGYKALTYKKGMTEYDYKMMETMKPAIIDGNKVISGKFTLLPDGHKTSFIYDGRSFESTIAPLGLLTLEQERSETVLQYAKDGDSFVLVGSKSEDLGWDGPDDVPLSIVIIGNNHEDLKVEASWNVSGVSVTENLNYMSTGFNGQYIEKVTITSDDPDAAYQLKILEAGKEVFDSKPRKGVGEIKYQRDVNKMQ